MWTVVYMGGWIGMSVDVGGWLHVWMNECMDKWIGWIYLIRFCDNCVRCLLVFLIFSFYICWHTHPIHFFIEAPCSFQLCATDHVFIDLLNYFCIICFGVKMNCYAILCKVFRYPILKFSPNVNVPGLQFLKKTIVCKSLNKIFAFKTSALKSCWIIDIWEGKKTK